MNKIILFLLIISFNLQRQDQSKFDKLIENLKSEKLETRKLHKVNKFFNGFKYISDEKQFSKKDYWMSLEEFLSSKKGDCEDYAIAKYLTLKKLGFKNLKLVFGRITNKKENSNHMILTYTNKNNETYVLDNRRLYVMPEKKYKDFSPIYSFDNKNIYLNDRKSLTKYKKTYPNNLKKFKKFNI